MTDESGDAPAPLTVSRVLGDTPFAPVGRPTAVASDPARGVVVVGGSLGALQWPGWLVGGRTAQHRVGVFPPDGARCLAIRPSRWPVNAVALHPRLPLAAVGTGSYDGGYAFEGELILLDLRSGDSVSVLRYGREIRALSWCGDDTLDVVAAPYTDDEDAGAHTHGYAFSLTCDDWTSVPERAFTAAEQAGPRVPCALPDDTSGAERELAGICAAAGVGWSTRRLVWAVEPHAAHGEGSVVAALDGVAAESWRPDGTRAWSVPDDAGGRQLHPAPDGRSVWVAAPRHAVWTNRRWQWLPTRVERLSLADGAVLDTLDTTSTAVLTGSTEGWFALRDAEPGGTANHGPARVFAAGRSGAPVGDLRLGGYDGVNHYFAVRRSPQLLFLRGSGKHHHLDKQIVVAEPAAGGQGWSVRTLFPLEWQTARPRHLFGGPGTYLHDGLGAAVVHAGTVHDGHGLLPGNAFVVRRRLPDGAPAWVFTADHAPTAVDTDGPTVYAAFTDGEVVALESLTGRVRWRHHLAVDGVATVALSLAVTPTGSLLLGTWDGRILDCRAAPAPA